MRDGVLTIPKRGKLNFLEIKEAEEAKAQLDDYISRLTHICNQLGDKADKGTLEKALSLTMDLPTSQITSAAIAEAQKTAKKREARKASFFKLWEVFLNEKKKEGLTFNTENGYKVVMRMMARYEGFVRQIDKERKNFAWDIDKVSREDIEDFIDYARNEHTLQHEYPSIFASLLMTPPAEACEKRHKKVLESRGENTMKFIAKKVRAFFKWINEKGYTSNMPLKDLQIKSEQYGTPWFLTIDERNKIADFDLTDSPKLEAQRDIFIFQCLIGCRVSDLFALTKSSVVNGGIEYIPRKTKDNKPVVVRVPLNGRAQAILEKYKDYKGKKLFPFISPQKYNDAIKEILTKCGIVRVVTVRNTLTGEQEQKPLNSIASSHMARRTFIGNLYKQVKDPNLIGKLSGHCEGSRAFARYRDIDEDLMKETVSLID